MNLEIFNGPAEVARAAASYITDFRPRSIALSGGSTPRLLYELLADVNEPFRDRIDWDHTHFFFTDERHVPPDQAESNYRMVNEALFSRAPIPRENIHRIRAENPDAEEAATNYEADLKTFFAEGIPAFDLILLGVGEEGHTASLFPYSSTLKDTTHLVAAPWVEKLNTYRITLTLPVLNNAKSVVFLVTGASKAEILRTLMETTPNPDLYPAQAISPTNGAVSWLVDKAAARLCSTSNSSNAGAGSDLLNKNP